MKSVKTMFKWMLAISTALSLTACGGDDGGSFLDDNGHQSSDSIELLVSGAKDDVSLSLGQQAPIEVRFHGQSDQALYVDLDKVSFEYQGEAIRIDSQASVLVGQAETAVPVSLVAKYQGMTSNAVIVSVSPASLSELQLTPESMTLAVGQRAELSVSAMYSNGLQTQLTPESVTWEVANEEVVRLDDGILTASRVGETTVTASYGGLTAQAQVVVSDATLDAIHLALLPNLDLLPTLAVGPIGMSEALAVVGVFSDGRTQALSPVTYHIDGDSVTQKDNVFTSVKAGLSSITADYVEPSTSNTLVTPAVLVSVTSAVIADGGLSITTPKSARLGMIVDIPLQLNAQAVWEDGSVFDVTSAAEWKIIAGQDVFELKDNGVVVGLKAGTGTVQATLNGEVASATLEVSDPDLSSLSIDPTNAVVSVGQTQAFVVKAHYANGTSVALSPEQLSFTVSDASVATMVDGVLTGHRDGTMTVKVVSKADPSKTATASVTVVDKAVQSVAVTVSASGIAVGSSAFAQAVVTYDDNTTETLEQNVSWHSSRYDVALITDGYIRGLAEGTTDISATYRGVTSTPVALSVSGKTIDSIQLMPSALTLSAGQTASLTVMAGYSDKSMSPLSDTAVTWKLAEGADKNVVSVDRSQVKALNAGQVDVIAQYDGRLEAKTTVTVTDATLNAIVLALKSDHTVLPSSYEAPMGMTVETAVLGLYSNGDSAVLSPVTYHLEGDSVERSGDVFTTVAGGLSSVTASYVDPTTGKEWTTPAVNVFVSGSTLQLDGLTITTPEAERHNMIKGVALPLTVMAQWDDGTSFNVSSASDWAVTKGDDVVQVNGVGVVTGKKAGEATVQATFNDKPVTTTLKVSDPALTSLSITPETAAVSVGQTQTLVVMGHYANDTIVPLSANQFSLSVGDAEVASIEDGVLTAKQGGSTTVTATFNDDTSQRATASITVIDKAVKSVSVTLEASTIAVGGSTQARALVTYVDDSTETVTNNVAWHTSEPEVALVTNGYVRALKASDSPVGISATYRGKTSAPAMLQVSGKTVERIQFTPSTLTLRDGQEADLNSYLMLVYSDKTVAPLSDFTQVTWKLDPADSNVVSLDRGKVTAQNQGDVTVVAQYPGVPKAEMSIKVSPAALEGVVLALKSDPTFLLPRSYPAPIEFSTQLAVVGVYTDGTRVLSPGEYVYDITGDAVTHKGDEFTTVKGGVSSITARYVGTETEETLVTPAVEVLVSNATIKEGGLSIVGPDNMVKGLPVKLTAQAIWDDGSVFNITTAATWAVTEGQANVSLDNDEPNVVTGNVAGETATVTATYGEQQASIVLTVSEASLDSLSINPAQVVLPVEQTQAFTITGHYDNETTQTLAASQFEFSVNNSSVGSIDSNGVLTAKAAGSTTVTATLKDDNTKSLRVPVTVVDKKVVDVKLSLDNDTITVGGSTNVSVEVKFEGDDSYTPITEGISWTSTKPDVALVMGSQVRGENAGETDITASYKGITSEAETLTVSGKTIDSLYFVPSSLSLPAGHETTLTVMAVYSDKSVDELSNNNIAWGLPENKGIASVDQYGVLTASKTNTGSEKVTATVSGAPAAEMTVTVNSATLESMALARKGGNLLPQGIEMQIGTVLSLEAKGFYSNEETHTLMPITYQLIKGSASADASLVSISNGEYEAVRPGLSTIIATYLDSTTGKSFDTTVSVSVSAAALDKVEITTPESDRHGMVVNVPLQLSVQAVWNDEDNTTYDITSAATWTVVEDKNDIFEDHVESSNVFVAKGVGQATVRANFQGKPSGDVTLKVTNATLSSYSLSPEVSVVKVGQSQTFVATAHYSNETDVTLSNNYDLEATLNGKTITADASTPDTLTFTEEGSAVVTLTVGGTSVATANVYVQKPEVKTLQVKVNGISTHGTVVVGYEADVTVEAEYQGNTTVHNVTDEARLELDGAHIALVADNKILGVSEGTTSQLKAHFGGKTATINITVEPLRVTLSKNGYWYGENSYLALGQSEPEAQATCNACSSGTSFTYTWQVDVDEDGDFENDSRAYTQDSYAPTRDDELFKNVRLVAMHADLDSSLTKDFIYRGAKGFSMDNSSVNALMADGSVVRWGISGNSILKVDGKELMSGMLASSVLNKDGSVISWGLPFAGGEAPLEVTTPQSDVKQLSVNHLAFAAIKGDGSLVSWGQPSAGGTMPVAVSQIKGVRQLISSSQTFAALKQDGTVIAWGDEDGVPSSLSTPSSNVVKIAATESQGFIALKLDGSVEAWGGISSAPITSTAIDIFTNSMTATVFKSDGSAIYWGGGVTPTEVLAPGSRVVMNSVVTSLNSFSALTQGGQVVSWGVATEGGDAPTSVTSLGAGVLKLVASDAAFSALKSDGSVVSWGLASKGGVTPSSVTSPKSNVVDIVSNGNAFLALKLDGSVVAWGDVNQGGAVPTELAIANSDVVDIFPIRNSLTKANTSGRQSGFAVLKKDGTLVVWGGTTVNAGLDQAKLALSPYES